MEQQFGVPLSQSLQELSETHDLSQGVLIGDLFDAVGTKGFGLLICILSLPSALPVPAPGYSTPFGIVLAMLAIQIMIGKKEPYIPGWARRRKVPAFLAKAMIEKGSKLVQKMEKLLHPRMLWAQNKVTFRIMSILILLMACLMILPIPGTNTGPALVILMIGVGLIERDGLFLSLASLGAVAAVALYGGIIFFLIYFGKEYGIDNFGEAKDFVVEQAKSLFSSGS